MDRSPAAPALGCAPDGNGGMCDADVGGDHCGCATAGAARAEDLPDQRPMLRIEPGMHTAPILRIGVDAACTLMATGSDDKTARLWALPEGGSGEARATRYLTRAHRRGHDGKVYAGRCRRTANGWRRAAGSDGQRRRDACLHLRSRHGPRHPPRPPQQPSLISPFRPMAAALPQRLAAAKAYGTGRREAGGCSPKTRTMAARTLTARPSMARTGSSPWPMTGKSAAMARMGGLRPRRRRGRGGAYQRRGAPQGRQTRGGLQRYNGGGGL